MRVHPMSAMAAASQRSTMDSTDRGAAPMAAMTRSASASGALEGAAARISAKARD